jgi:hypothetical protein
MSCPRYRFAESNNVIVKGKEDEQGGRVRSENLFVICVECMEIKCHPDI